MRILLAFDGSAGAEAARDLAAHLPWPSGTAITVVTALERGPDLFGAPEVAVVPHDSTEAEELLFADLQEALTQAAVPLRSPSRFVETRVLRGRPATALLDEARHLNPDLIVIGSRGHGPLASLLLGSVSTEVVDHAPCPVLVARRPAVHRMIVAVDGSESAERGIATLTRWPIFTGIPARVVSVAERPPQWAASVESISYPAWTRVTASSLDDRRAQLEAAAARAAEELARAGIPAQYEVCEGDPATALIGTAEADGADLIVIGSRGLSTLPRLLLGSVARKVLHHTHVSVLVVRALHERVHDEARSPIVNADRMAVA